METSELFYPRIEVSIGPYLLDEGIMLETHSSQDSYFDWGKIRFTEEYKPELTLEKMLPASISLGYEDDLKDVFNGYVSKPYDGGLYTNEINMKDDMLLLENTVINNTFLDTTPQEIIKYILSEAGILRMNLSDAIYPERKKIPIKRMNAINAINFVNSTWKSSNKFFFQDGIFYWGLKPDQSKIYSFEYGENIIKLSRIGGIWELETASMPYVKHSQKINVIHPQISGDYEVKKISTVTNDDGFLRTKIYF